jgi:hypothetical protein
MEGLFKERGSVKVFLKMRQGSQHCKATELQKSGSGSANKVRAMLSLLERVTLQRYFLIFEFD